MGCGARLARFKKVKRKDGNFKVTCTCGRIFIYNTESKKYRRALLEEV